MDIAKFEEIANRTPVTHPWGYYLQADLPPMMCGSSIGAFVWAGTAAEAVDQLEEELVEHWFDPAKPLTRPEVIPAVRPLLEQLKEGVKDSQAKLGQINEHTRGVVLIEWFGDFESLLSGSGEFARGLRQTFWELRMEEDPDAVDSLAAPIPEEDRAEFAELLRDWGV